MKEPRTTETIAKISGLSKQTVLRISRLRTWRDVTLGQIEAFKLGCGITPGKGEPLQIAYLKRSFDKSQTATPLFHLRRLLKKHKDKRLEQYLTELLRG
jgi:hypothetical protein